MKREMALFVSVSLALLIPNGIAAAQSNDASAPPALPKQLRVGKEGTLQFGSNLQAWFLLDDADATTNTFRMRRAELSLKGDLAPKWLSFGLMIDPSRALEFKTSKLSVGESSISVKQPPGSVSIFQDAYLTIKTSIGDLSAGQFKTPVSWEGFNSSSKLLFAERASVARQLGDKRDLGLKLNKSFETFALWAFVVNGAGQNSLDGDGAKDGALRAEFYPIKGLTLGGVLYGTLWERDRAGAKDRYEADIRYESGPLLLQAEFIHAADRTATNNVAHSEGTYAAIGWKLTDTIQPALRVGYLDPDTKQNLDPAASKGQDEFVHYDVGVNWFLDGPGTKLQLNYSHFQYDRAPAIDELIVAAQLSF